MAILSCGPAWLLTCLKLLGNREATARQPPRRSSGRWGCELSLPQSRPPPCYKTM